MAHVFRQNVEKGMSLPEIEATFNILVVAGSETTATTLAGIMNYLLKDMTVMEPLVQEIRGSFASSSEITPDRVAQLPYLTAVIEEGLRLCQPVPLGSPRKVPRGGATVCGHWLPENVSAGIPFRLFFIPPFFPPL
jgi:cytochrome P450